VQTSDTLLDIAAPRIMLNRLAQQENFSDTPLSIADCSNKFFLFDRIGASAPQF